MSAFNCRAHCRHEHRITILFAGGAPKSIPPGHGKYFPTGEGKSEDRIYSECCHCGDQLFVRKA